MSSAAEKLLKKLCGNIKKQVLNLKAMNNLNHSALQVAQAEVF